VRRVAGALLGACTFVAASRDASAAAGTAFADTARVTGLGYAVTARRGDPGTMLRNPAGLADVHRPTIVLGAQALGIVASFARTGEASEDRSRFTGSFTIAAATPLPGVLHDLRIGFALDVPAGHVLRVAVGPRDDTPSSPIWDARPERVSALFALGFPVGQFVRVGAGVAVVPSLATPTTVNYVAGRDPSVDRSVVVRLERALDVGVVPFFGLRTTPTRALALGLSWRAAAASSATGSQRTVAGGIVADDPIDFYQFWDPETLTLGGALVVPGTHERLSASADLALARWSRFESGRHGDVDPRFRDTFAARFGFELLALPWLVVRLGGGGETNPIPAQTKTTNYLGSALFHVGGGAGIDLHRIAKLPLAVDAQVSGFFGPAQSATKDVAPGQVVGNLGYPGFRSTADAVHFGVTLTVFAGGP
jgi:hypothetical protein